MRPIKSSQTTLDDLLERLLDTGIVLHTDLIISVANIPLIGISLKAAIASMETLLKYGFFQDLDTRTRQWALDHIRDRKLRLNKDEKIENEMYGFYLQKEGIYHSWKSAKLYFTKYRLILYQQLTAEVIYTVRYNNIRNVRSSFMEKDDKGVIILHEKDGSEQLIYVYSVSDFLSLLDNKTKANWK